MFKDIINEELDDNQIIAKIAKKMFGKDFLDVKYGGEVIYLKSDTARWNDLKDLEVNLSSFRIGDIVCENGKQKIILTKKK